MENKVETYTKIIALTGSSGSGKSTVAQLLHQKGATIVSADELSREAVKVGSPILKQLTEEFGNNTLLANGNLNRAFLHSEIFSCPLKKAKAEGIIHPKVKSLALEKFNVALETSNVVIYDVPLYFEAGLDKLPFKASILVYASEADSIKRIMLRDCLKEIEAKNRLNSQITSTEKLSKVTHVINNSGSMDDLEIAVQELWGHL